MIKIDKFFHAVGYFLGVSAFILGLIIVFVLNLYGRGILLAIAGIVFLFVEWKLKEFSSDDLCLLSITHFWGQFVKYAISRECKKEKGR